MSFYSSKASSKFVMSRRDNENAEALMQALTPDELAYFIAVTDIFHDEQFNVVGRPSVSSQLQNCVVFNGSVDLTSSLFGIPATDKWDLNVASLPWITKATMSASTDTGFVVTTATPPTTRNMSGLTCFGAVAGTADIIMANQTVVLDATSLIYPQYATSTAVPIARPYYQILSIGFEAINATPSLYKGGNVIRYRLPGQNRSASIALSDPVLYPNWPTQAREQFFCIPLPPRNAQLAAQYPDSVIDEAAAGSYQLHTLQDQVSDFYLAGNSRIFMSTPNQPTTPTGYNSFISASCFNPTYDFDPPLLRGDFDMVGSYFQGLDPNAIITLRYRVVVSTVPSSSEASLMSLAKMSPPANSMLDELVSMVQNDFLPGVPAGLNPRGEWWKDILNSAMKHAPDVGLAIAGPVGKQTGELARDVTKVLTKKKPKKNPKKPQPKPQPKK